MLSRIKTKKIANDRKVIPDPIDDRKVRTAPKKRQLASARKDYYEEKKESAGTTDDEH